MITVREPISIADLTGGQRRRTKTLSLLAVAGVIGMAALGAYKLRDAMCANKTTTLGDEVSSASLGIGARAMVFASRILPPAVLLRLSSLIVKFSRSPSAAPAVNDNISALSDNGAAIADSEQSAVD